MSAISKLSRKRLRLLYRVMLLLVAVALALLWQQFQTPPSILLTNETSLLRTGETAIESIPTDFSVDQDKFRLGEKLFKDDRLSAGAQVACISCHKFDHGGADSSAYSEGMNGALTKVNTPTVFNVAFNFRFNWDGQHETLAAHTDKLMQNPGVMASDWTTLSKTLGEIAEYQKTFGKIYGDGVTKDNVIDAIVTYESGLVTPDSRFDQYLQGDEAALSDTEKRGYDLFKFYGCVSCHQGTNIGGNMFQKFGVIGDYFADKGRVDKADLGRFNVTNDPADRHVFRVPSLRNVAVTPPYLHDGTAQTLEEAINVMVKYQLGRPIPGEDVKAIAQFLKTLTGKYQGVYLQDMTNVTEKS